MTSPTRQASHPCLPEEATPPSREEIETLCILHTLVGGPCSVGELTSRLGLAPDVTHAVAAAIEPLVAAGHVEEREGLLRQTDAGRAWMDRRLAALGCA